MAIPYQGRNKCARWWAGSLPRFPPSNGGVGGKKSSPDIHHLQVYAIGS